MQASRRAHMKELADRALRLLHRYEPVSRVVRHVTTIEAFNLGLILAAQAFLTLVPLLIVLATFAPRLLGVGLSNELQASLGLSNSSLAFRDMLGPPEHASRVGGLLGFVLLVSAGTSIATALQRCYERIWSARRGGPVLVVDTASAARGTRQLARPASRRHLDRRHPDRACLDLAAAHARFRQQR